MASFSGLGGVLGPFWAVLGLVKPGHERSGQVRSSQVRSGQAWALPLAGTGARSGQGGVHPSYKDGSALENPSISYLVLGVSWGTLGYLGGVLGRPEGVLGRFGGVLRASWGVLGAS